MKLNSKGFTLIELLIFLAIFSVVVIAFITIFISVLRVYSRQAASAEVNRQSQMVLQTIQYYVERSSVIEMNKDEATTTIKLRMPENSVDPTYIYLSNGIIYLKETDSGSPQQITTSRVNVSSASFTRRDNAPAKDSVDVSFTIEYVTDDLKKQYFVQNLDTSIARVSAATFDSDVIASSSNTYNLGVSAGNWRSINSTVYFNSSNVGIGVSSPSAKLQVSGGDIYVDTTGNGIILRSANGNCWRVAPTNTGMVTSTSVACP